MKIKKIYIAIGCMMLCVHANAQSKAYTEKDYAKSPLWIEMLDDTTANYFVVEKAFNIYFKNHELPESEHEEIGEYAEHEKAGSRKKQKRIEEESYMRRQVRKYERWHEKMLPYVQSDGRILTPTERLAIWQQIKDENNRK
jgi:hypothetical protein